MINGVILATLIDTRDGSVVKIENIFHVLTEQSSDSPASGCPRLQTVSPESLALTHCGSPFPCVQTSFALQLITQSAFPRNFHFPVSYFKRFKGFRWRLKVV